MLTFANLWEQMQADVPQVNPLMGSDESTKAEELIRAGEQLRSEEESGFWDDFLKLLSNNEGFAHLLGVKAEDVLAWPGRIKEIRAEVEQKKQQTPGGDEETQVLPTGNNGAIASNSDPIL